MQLRTGLIACFLVLGSIVQAVSMELSNGWNLVSPLLDSEEVPVTTWLGQVGLQQSDVAKIWEFQDTWKFWAADGSGALTSVKRGQGYWLLMNGAKTINITAQGGSSLTLNFDKAGWFLIGSNVNASVPISGSAGLLEPANFSLGGPESLLKIWEFALSWKSWSPADASPQLTALSPNRGYWIYSSAGLNLDDGNADLADLLPPVCPGCPPIQ